MVNIGVSLCINARLLPYGKGFLSNKSSGVLAHVIQHTSCVVASDNSSLPNSASIGRDLEISGGKCWLTKRRHRVPG